MKITAITKLKQGDLWDVMKRLNWNQSELARRTGIAPVVIGEILNLKKKPTEFLLSKIQNAFAEEGEFIDVFSIWPDRFKGFNQRPIIEQTREVSDNVLIGMINEQNPQISYENKEQIDILNKTIVTTLTEREEFVIENIHFSNKSLADIGREMGISRERVREINLKAMGKIKNKLLKINKTGGNIHENQS
jgi:RNA polymerase sigma factor (sigma-70 family)